MTEIKLKSKLLSSLFKEVHIAPLITFRMLFGTMMFLGILRFALNGWIEELYIKPEFYFTYYGFEWVKPFGNPGMYIVFILMALAALFIALGLFYKISAITFFITFTYVELIDKSTYLNHYYFISIVALLMIFLPAGNYLSVDTILNKKKTATYIPKIFIIILQLQLGIVYFFAGIAKLNYYWLFEAMPLKMWLPPHSHLPVIGIFLDKLWVAYFFSWFGAIYDLTIPFFLINKKTRPVAYFFVIIFHLLTSLLFNIGMFPYIMIVCTLIFFSEKVHIKFLSIFNISKHSNKNIPLKIKPIVLNVFTYFVALHFIFQLLIPFRYLLYPGNLFWTEQGFRFSWRVMLMEKAGKVFFHVTDPQTGKKGEAMMDNSLTILQEKMMSTQPDMILQYAHYLKNKYNQMGIKNPEIRAESYVTFNGRGSRLFIDSTVDLTKINDSFKHKYWILPFTN